MSLARPRVMRPRRRPKSAALSSSSLLSSGSAEDAKSLLQLQKDANTQAAAAATAAKAKTGAKPSPLAATEADQDASDNGPTQDDADDDVAADVSDK
jgi:hypothetical protein